MEELVQLDKPLEKEVAAAIDFECDRIRAEDEIDKDPYVLLVDGIGKLSKGNISAWQGIAKSKKTFGITLTVAGLVRGESLHPKFQPVAGGKLVWIDTEQSPYDAQKVTKRLFKMCGGDYNLLFYALRKYGAKTRVQKIEAILEKYKGQMDCLIIDGIRDLIIDFNDPVESSEITTKLMAWSIDYNIHISVVLHANKSDGNMRGHLGTELENKCETVFAVKKDEQYKDVSHIEEKFGRGKNVEPFKFKVNAEGLPELVDDDHILVDDDDTPPWER